ncbi:SOS response-associated peptidase family protein [Bosea sp. LjRoot237]|uniref:SOS response-associated peptidase family protein n=1 Tax=Bosea sp. LjRoot237 TaxID=3342292 RepID=UPI003ECD1B38
MCGKFTQSFAPPEVLSVFDGVTIEGGTQLVRKSFNISPTDQISIIVMVDGQRVLKPARWGYIPKWWNKPLKEKAARICCNRLRAT